MKAKPKVPRSSALGTVCGMFVPAVLTYFQPDGVVSSKSNPDKAPEYASVTVKVSCPPADW